ncbi:glycosyltransferase [Streptomyces sp. N35]|uniref:glycosyltransferase family 2 protein n=1 Tax=Streptomyces sp. N35 TaxID=2795730 RepID=UPI0018F408BE|nr:glycosyltransferase [Streptomyces sp. N35]
MLSATRNANPGTGPMVSVIVAVYNAMPYIVECIDSLQRQTIGIENIEIIAVNDGSTDGSGAELDRIAERVPQLRVLHQENSGGPSQPRNKGFDVARGRYVYILDADDYIGPEALERLVAMAEEQQSDVVLGKMVGLGRGVSELAFKHAKRADLYKSEIYRSLGPQKLVRRSLIEANKIRFAEDLWLGEDQIFCTEIFLAATAISVVGDYDCYYARRREDGQQLTRREKTPYERVAHIERVMALISERVTDPDKRRILLARHFRAIIDKTVLIVVKSNTVDEAFRQETYRLAKALCDTYWEDAMAAHLPALSWLRLYCFLNGKLPELEILARYKQPDDLKDLVEVGRVLRPYPFFRDPEARIPDAIFDVTDRLKMRHEVTDVRWAPDGTLAVSGFGYIDRVDTRGVSTVLVLRERHGNGSWTVPLLHTASPQLTEERGRGVYEFGNAGWQAALDFDSIADGEPLRAGIWDLWLSVQTQGVIKETRLVPPRRAGWEMPASRAQGVTGATVSPYRTKGNKFAVDVGGTFRGPTARGLLTEQRWAGDALHFQGAGWIENFHGRDVQPQVVLRCRQSGDEVLVPTREEPVPMPALSEVAAPGVAAKVGFAASLDPMTAFKGHPLPYGVWDAFVRLTAPGVQLDARLRGAKALSLQELWRVRAMTGGREDFHLVTPYLTKHGYAAIDAEGNFFTPHNQLLISDVRRHPRNREDIVVRGRVGVVGVGSDDVVLRVTDGNGDDHTSHVRLTLPWSDDPVPEAAGPEKNVAGWPAFTAVVRVGDVSRFRRPQIAARLELSTSGRVFESDTYTGR